MLNWICPECGRENDPTFAECPCLNEPRKPARFRAAPRPAQQAPEVVLATPEPATACCAISVSEPEPRLAPRIAAATGPVDLSVHGPALIAMLRAIQNEPKLLAPALEMRAPADGRFCGRVPQPNAVPEPRPGVAGVRQEIAPVLWQPTTAIAGAEPTLDAARVPARCTGMLTGSLRQPTDPGPAPLQPRALARSRRRIAFPSSEANQGLFQSAPLSGLVEAAPPVFTARTWFGESRGLIGPIRRRTVSMPALPSALRRFQEAVVPRIAYVKRTAPVETVAAVPRRRGLPPWMISIATAAVVLVAALFAVQHFGGQVEAHANAATPAAPAQRAPAAGAWPSIDRFVEVTALRLTTDQKKNSEAAFTVVNHSSTEVGPTAVNVTLPAANGGAAPLCDVTTNVAALGPWESREVRVPLTRELHASDLPDWHDLHPQVQITSAQ